MLPENSAQRKTLPVTEGVLKYFPLAIAYIALVSKVGNDKHNPGEPLHWSRGKSDDHADCIGRHLLDLGTYAGDGLLHDGMLAWRALANLQITLERLEKAGFEIYQLHGGLPPAPDPTGELVIGAPKAPRVTAAVTGASGATHVKAAEHSNAAGNGGGTARRPAGRAI
jgi:hypothetical protein